MPPKGAGKGRGKSSKKTTAPRRRREEEEEEDEVSEHNLSSNVSDDDDDEPLRPAASGRTRKKTGKQVEKPKKKRRNVSSMEEDHDSSASSRAASTQQRRTSDDDDDDDDDEDDQPAATSSRATTPAPKRKPMSAPLILDADTETNLAEWLQGHPLFYDKRHPEHCDRKKKEGLIADKARELRIDPARLATWLKNVRDRVNSYAKRVVKHSGDPDNDDELHSLTERQKQLFINFRFLREYIVPHKRKTKTGGLSTAPSTAPSTTAASHRTASPQPGPSRLSRPPAPSLAGSADDVVVNPAPSSVPRGSIMENPVSAEVCTEISCCLSIMKTICFTLQLQLNLKKYTQQMCRNI